MRCDDIVKNNQELNKKLPLNTDVGRQKALLSVLTDISESLALIVDLYAAVHGRVISRKEPDNADVK